MNMDAIRNPNAKLAVIKAGQLALAGHRRVLKSKIMATDMAIRSLAALADKEKRIAPAQDTVITEEIKKETKGMKHLLAGIVAVAAVGAVVGAGYAYYKKNKAVATEEDYEELIFSEDDGEVEYVEVDTKMDRVVRAANDVKDVVVSAAENVADTVSDAFYDVKEAINNAIED